MLERARTTPDDLALDDLSRTRSWGQLEARIGQLVRLFRARGLTPGSHAAYLIGNRIEAIELTLAGLIGGVWITPINRHLTRPEIEYILRDSDARLVFADAGHLALARGAATADVVEVGAELDALLAPLSGDPWPHDGPAGGSMMYTSGTTGRPKGVKRHLQSTVAEALARSAAVAQAIGLRGDGPHLVTGPLYHAAPLLFAVYDLVCGAPVVVMPRWDAAQALDLIEQRDIAHTHLVPTMFVRLLALPAERRAAFRAPHLSLVLHGAAPIAPHVKAAMIEWWGPTLVEYWGATEGGVYTLVTSADWQQRPGTVGKPIPTYDVFAVDDAGARLPAGEVGTLYCKHAELSRAFAYHGDDAKTTAAYDAAGAFSVGDLGWVDDDGYVFLSGRASTLIISGGVNIYPVEIEQVLQQHTAVADVGVYGVPDAEWGERVAAAVELRPGHAWSDALRDDLAAFARARLAGYKVPRLPSGKIRRAALAKTPP